MHNIRNLIAHHKWDLPDRNVPGITWLELLAMYEDYGYNIDIPAKHKQPRHKHTPTNSTKTTLQIFKKLMQFVATNCINELDQDYFRASKAPSRRLNDFAILQNIPSIRALPLIDDDTANNITRSILFAKGKHITHKHITLLDNNNLQLPRKAFS